MTTSDRVTKSNRVPVTNRVTPEQLAPLLTSLRTATLASVTGTAADVMSVAFHWRAGRVLVGLHPDDGAAPGAGDQVAVCADAGVGWWDLRALLVRGRLEPSAPPDPPDTGVAWYDADGAWYEVITHRVTAWDYGALRRAEAGDGRRSGTSTSTSTDTDTGTGTDNGTGTDVGLGAATAEMRAFLRGAPVARVATRSPSGNPFLTPLWFVTDGPRLVLTTAAASVTVRNLRRDDHITMLIDGDGAAGRTGSSLRVEGTATVTEELPRLRLLTRIARKYYLSGPGLRSEMRHLPAWRLRRAYYGQAEPAMITVRPREYRWIQTLRR